MGGGGGGYAFAACLSRLTLDHASLSRRSTVPTPNRDTANVWALIMFLSCVLHERFLSCDLHERFIYCVLLRESVCLS